jgi:hypothetical protein
MAWQAVDRTPRANLASEVSMSLRTDNQRELRYAYVNIGQKALEELGAKKGDKLRIERGTGDNHGWLRISKAQSGHALGIQSGKSDRLRVYFRAWSTMSQVDQSSIICEWRSPGVGIIEVRLPPWAYSEEAARQAPRREHITLLAKAQRM